MNIVIFGYYGFKDGYYAYGNYFSKFFDSVSFFPIIEFMDRIKEKNPKYNHTHLNSVVDGTFNTNIASLYSENTQIINTPKQIVIICHNNDMLEKLMLPIGKSSDNPYGELFINYMQNLKQMYNFKLIQINWDPLLGLPKHNIINNFDLSFCSDPKYIKFNPKCKFFKAGYCKKTSYNNKTFDKNYECDVSFIGTNLYVCSQFENKLLTRKDVLDKIYNESDLILHVYGPSFLKNIYPKAYKGFISYDDCYKVFSNSKICVNVSPCYDNEFENNHYYSERLPQIFGCESIMLSNNDFGSFLVKDVDYIYIDNKDTMIEKIKNLLVDEKMYDEMKKNVVGKKEMFEYECIVEELSDVIKQL